MIKAKKGLIITLFAAMMVFAFGATSAFAAQTNTWSDNYSKCTVSGVTEHNNYQYNAEVTFDNTTGLIHAQVTQALNDDISWTVPDAEYWFYDLNGAYLYAEGYGKLLGTYDYGDYPGTAYFNKVVLVEPSYTTDYDAKNIQKTDPKPLSNGLKEWTAEVSDSPKYDKDSKAEQSFTVTAEGTYKSAYDGTEGHPQVLNAIPAKEVKVLGKDADAHDLYFFKDEVVADTDEAICDGYYDSTNTVSFLYDGAAHKVVNNEVTGVKVSYEVFNAKSGGWDAVSECPAVTNVADTAKVRATTTWTKTTVDGDKTTTETIKKVQNFNLSVSATEAPTFGFDPDGEFAYNEGNYGYVVESLAQYNEWDFVVVNPAESDALIPAQKRAEDAAYAAAVAANETEWKAFVQDFDKIVKTTKKAAPGHEYLSLERKTSDEISDAAFKDLKEKYKALLENFGLTDASKYTLTTMLTTGATKADVAEDVVYNVNEDDITFTFAPNATYHVKKAKKMKKTKSFTVEAVAKSGNAINYQLTTPNKKISIDPATGKITVKKGLKKGTYKVTVKATTDAGNGYKACKESVKLTIKVKK